MNQLTGEINRAVEVDGQTALLEAAPFRRDLTRTVASRPSRCRCRPACLSNIIAGEQVVAVRGGWALLEHAEQVA